MLQEMEMSFLEDRFEITSESSNGSHPYDKIHRVYSTRDHFFIYMGKRVCFIVPKRNLDIDMKREIMDHLRLTMGDKYIVKGKL